MFKGVLKLVDATMEVYALIAKSFSNEAGADIEINMNKKTGECDATFVGSKSQLKYVAERMEDLQK